MLKMHETGQDVLRLEALALDGEPHPAEANKRRAKLPTDTISINTHKEKKQT